MTSDTTPPRASTKWRKLLFQLMGGLIFGALVGYGAGHWAGGYAAARGLESLPPSVTIAGMVAVIYILMSALVLAGSISPAVGAKILNVEDADEVREMQSQFVTSGAAMLVWGLALLGLALAAPVGPLAPPVALTIGAGGLIIGLVFAVKGYRDADELMLATQLEAGAITYGLVLVVVGGWAIGAHLGYAPAPAPLDLLTAFYVLVLAASFIAAGRRGMLRLR
ncbi:hypothetical protein [Porphyrobacter sp. AAP60]|uniref:hypothetical protein n=1 Tax=Porphyrobacter sp. AAP60 TaxID=1523423 RepID=UPI0006B966D9|nr:hypothetical protein [Porphyrobacter sp. AAP60]KPF61949.1 hypothetical protein IP79_13815 [Porphyrobacter sp. AAP60]